MKVKALQLRWASVMFHCFSMKNESFQLSTLSNDSYSFVLCSNIFYSYVAQFTKAKHVNSFKYLVEFAIIFSLLFFNMICSLSMTYSHPSKITKWPHILVLPLVGPPKPRTKSKNSPTHLGTEKREAKVVILGNFRGGLRVLFHRFQTWACGYEEI